MDLTQFVSVSRSILEAWEAKPPADLYRPLISALNQVLENPGAEASEKVRAERARITKYHEDFELGGTFGPYGRRVLTALGAEKVLGNGANEQIAKVFAANQADPGGAAAGLDELLRDAEAVQHRLLELQGGFGSYWEQANIGDEDASEDRVTVIFDRVASARSVGDLEDSITQWIKTLGAFTRLSANPCEEPRYLTADRESLHLEIQTDGYTASALSFCLDRVLGARKRLLDISRELVGVRLLSLRNNEVEKLLAEQQEEERESLIDEIADAVVDTFPAQTKSDDFGQAGSYVKVVAVKGAVRDIYAFVEEGGEIDVVLPAESETEELRPVCGRLRQGFSGLRALEYELHALETKSPERPPADDDWVLLRSPGRGRPAAAENSEAEIQDVPLKAVGEQR